MKKIILALALLCVPAAAAYARPQPSCGAYKPVLRQLLTAAQLPVASGAERHGFMVQVFAGAHGQWTVLGIAPDETACVLMRGHDWHFAVFREG